jgi:hypothetical protein
MSTQAARDSLSMLEVSSAFFARYAHLSERRKSLGAEAACPAFDPTSDSAWRMAPLVDGAMVVSTPAKSLQELLYGGD